MGACEHEEEWRLFSQDGQTNSLIGSVGGRGGEGKSFDCAPHDSVHSGRVDEDPHDGL